MNRAISWKKDEHFSGMGKEYECTNAYCSCGSPMVEVLDDHKNLIAVDINDKDFDFVFNNSEKEKKETETA